MKRQKRHATLMVHIVLILGSIMMLFPFVWMVLTALKTQPESLQSPPTFFPKVPQWDNFLKIFTVVPFGSFFFNTVVATLVITVGQVMICALAAYPFARLNFPFKNTLFVIVLSILMVPGQVFIIPQYLIMQRLELLNSIPALFLPGLFSAFGTFLLRQFFATIPKSIEEAAIIDGLSRPMIFFKIILPLSRSALVSLAIFALLFGWNQLLWPLIVNTTPDKMTLSAGLASLNGQYASNFPMIMAGSFLASIPLIIMFLIFQKQFIEGIALSGGK